MIGYKFQCYTGYLDSIWHIPMRTRCISVISNAQVRIYFFTFVYLLPSCCCTYSTIQIVSWHNLRSVYKSDTSTKITVMPSLCIHTHTVNLLNRISYQPCSTELFEDRDRHATCCVITFTHDLYDRYHIRISYSHTIRFSCTATKWF